MNARTAGRSKSATVPPATVEDLGLADAVDVLDGAELGAVDAAHRAADDLVPVVRAPGEVVVRADGRLEVGTSQAVGAVARRDLAEAEPPAGPVRDGLGRGDRQRPVVALAEEDVRRRRSGPPGGR